MNKLVLAVAIACMFSVGIRAQEEGHAVRRASSGTFTRKLLRYGIGSSIGIGSLAGFYYGLPMLCEGLCEVEALDSTSVRITGSTEKDIDAKMEAVLKKRTELYRAAWIKSCTGFALIWVGIFAGERFAKFSFSVE